jgi:hypothetical protein
MGSLCDVFLCLSTLLLLSGFRPGTNGIDMGFCPPLFKVEVLCTSDPPKGHNWAVPIGSRTNDFIQVHMQHECIMLSFLSCSLVQFKQPRRSAPTEGNNVTVKPDCGRVTAIPYSWLATRLRSLAIIIHTPIYCHLSPCFISKMYVSYWKPVGVSERMWSVNSDASISEEYQTLGGHSCWPSEYMGALDTHLGAPG